MKLSEYRKRSNEYTSKASEIIRQLCLAGIAIIWLFKNSDNNEAILDPFLIWPLITLSLALFVDLLQYIIGGQTWINFFRKKEKEFQGTNEDDPEIKAPENLRLPIYFCYYTKIVLIFFSYLFT